MPYIGVKTNIALDEVKKNALKMRLGKAIEIIPGKTEAWLMVALEGKIPLYFKGGSDSPLAMVEVALLGSAAGDDYEKLTAEICNILEDEAGIPQNGVYVKYEECEHWGWNGTNF